MGNTISEDLPESDCWWQQLSQAQSTNEAHTTVPSSNTISSKSFLNTQEDIDAELASELECTKLTFCDSTSTTTEEANRRKVNEEKMELFKSELAKKHLARRQAIAERSKEILFLREELARYKKESEELRESFNKTQQHIPDTSWKEEMEALKQENIYLKEEIAKQQETLGQLEEVQQHNHELRVNIAEVQEELQAANAQAVNFEREREEYQTHVSAMKEVVKVSKQLLEIRENQLEDLRAKVTEIESNLAAQENSMLSTNLRNEYEKQLRNMQQLRTLYEQRQAAVRADRDAIANDLTDTQKKLENEQKNSKELQERIEELEKDASDKYDKVQSLESQLGLAQAECRGLQAEMNVINQLFSQILVGFNNGQVDLDKLIKLLEENHDLLTDIVINEESVEHSSALPKTLLDLVNQVQEKQDEELGTNVDNTQENVNENGQNEPQITSNQMSSAAEIVHNLPKVWRVLAELLSQQSGQQPVVISDDGIDPCYKSIETPKGPKVVLSVSQTFIRLKDLILEKKSLEKEMTRLKSLNTHLEVRLQDQEKRLETVSTELSKTWHVVGRMQRQHQQLHTHEKILRYELAQKRKMLTELKEELEYCREKWVQAREKNSNTEEQWKKLRTEFASRKTTIADDLNNSAESGYSDERECSSDDDSSYDSNKKKATPVPVKNNSDVEDNDETSHGSDVDDLLESAFSKACSTNTVEQPQLQLSEFVTIHDETNIQTCDNLETSQTCESIKEETQENETEEVQTKLDTSLPTEEQVSPPILELSLLTQETSLPTQEILLPTQETSLPTQEMLLPTQETSLPTQEMLLPTSSNEISLESSPEPSTSQTEVQRTSEDILSKREERLRRLEEQCQQLVKKVTNTTNRRAEICTRLQTLHEQYGSSDNSNRQNEESSQENTESGTQDNEDTQGENNT